MSVRHTDESCLSIHVLSLAFRANWSADALANKVEIQPLSGNITEWVSADFHGKSLTRHGLVGLNQRWKQHKLVVVFTILIPGNQVLFVTGDVKDALTPDSREASNPKAV